MVRAKHELLLSVKKLALQIVFLALFLSFPLTVYGAILSCDLKGVTDSDEVLLCSSRQQQEEEEEVVVVWWCYECVSI